MEVLEAILSRRSIRDFSSKPVPRETVMKILETAVHSPSSGNGQPWEVFVAAGNTLERIRRVYLERFQSGAGSPPAARPPQPAFIQQRMAVIRKERFELLGLDPDDPASGKVFLEWGSRMFGAPVLAVVCMDKAISSNLDMGLFIQTVCLAARGYGVDSFIASGFITHQDVLRKELSIPDDLNIVTGIGLGYADPDAVINSYQAPRRPVGEVVRYRD